VLEHARDVVIDDQPGDVVIFPGRSMWHKRRNPARVTNLYLKFNDFGSDPLGEDPTTDLLRANTAAVLAQDGALRDAVPVRGRLLDMTYRQTTRDGLQVIFATVLERNPLRLSERELALLEAADGRRTLGELWPDADGPAEPRPLDVAVRRLARHGVLDLIAP
jgi:hypothetical protein